MSNPSGTGKAGTRAPARAEAWSHYWQSGSRDSCSLGATGLQADVMTKNWQEWFSCLPDGCSLLDVGTGNGTLALLAAETLAEQKKSARVMGIDAADIRPDPTSLAAVDPAIVLELKGRSAAETISEPDESFTHVVAQYALEYSDTRKSLLELFRVLRRGGEGRFLIHSQDSLVIQNAQKDLEALAELLDDLALTRKAKRVLKARDRSRMGQGVTKVSQADARMSEALAKLDAVMASGPPSEHHAYFRQTMSDLFQRRNSPNPLQYMTFLDQLEEEMERFRERLRQMQAAARSEQDIEALARQLEAAGWQDVKWAKEAAGDTVFGWLLTARKA